MHRRSGGTCELITSTRRWSSHLRLAEQGGRDALSAAIFQSIVARLRRLEPTTWAVSLAELIEENKWRAMRHGVNGKLIDFGKREEREFGFLLEELVRFVDPVLDDLGSRAEVEYAFTILREGTPDRQLARYEESEGIKAVVDLPSRRPVGVSRTMSTEEFQCAMQCFSSTPKTIAARTCG